MELDNAACFVHDVRYVKNKNLAKRTFSDKVLKKRIMEFCQSLKIMDIKKDRWMLCTSIFDKTTRSEVNVNEVLAQESNKPVVRKKMERKKCIPCLKIIFGQ